MSLNRKVKLLRNILQSKAMLCLAMRHVASFC